MGFADAIADFAEVGEGLPLEVDRLVIAVLFVVDHTETVQCVGLTTAIADLAEKGKGLL